MNPLSSLLFCLLMSEFISCVIHIYISIDINRATYTARRRRDLSVYTEFKPQQANGMATRVKALDYRSRLL